MSDQPIIVTPATNKRTVVVYSTSLGKKFVIETVAQTYGELKADLSQVIPSADLNLENSKVFEGYAKLAFESDTAQLPKNIMTPQGLTNNLTLIIAPKQKMKSGMSSRTELYAKIKGFIANGGEKAKNFFNKDKNYTNKSTDELVKLVSSYEKKNSPSPVKAAQEPTAKEMPVKKSPTTSTVVKETAKVSESVKQVEVVQISKASLNYLIEGLNAMRTAIDCFNASGIVDATTSSVSNEDISIYDLQKLAKN